MNRALLIIICDFLLLSLLSLARFDVQDQHERRGVLTPDYAAGSSDLVDVLKLALEEERLVRQQLTGELASSRQTLDEQQRLLAQRDQRLQAFQQSLQDKEAEARRLEAERSRLQDQFVSTQANLQALQVELTEASTEALISREKLDVMEEELRLRRQEAQRMQDMLSELERRHELTQAEKHQLVTQLQVVETEKRITQERVSELVGEVQTVRQEAGRAHETAARAQEHATNLAQGVTVLAEKSGELTEEIRQHRPLPANVIFNEFYTNRVQTRFEARRSGFLGREVHREKQTQTVIVTDGTQYFALYHIDDTPLSLGSHATDWSSLSGVLNRRGVAFSLVRLSFAAVDPRIILVPVGESQARQLGASIYRIASDPFRFEEAVLVGASEGYYGEARFRLDPETPQYVRMDRSLFRGIFGRFNPSRGDLVFSKTGELLGIMVNNEYCAVLTDLTISRSLPFGQDISAFQAGQVLSQLGTRVDRLPMKLQ